MGCRVGVGVWCRGGCRGAWGVGVGVVVWCRGMV